MFFSHLFLLSLISQWFMITFIHFAVGAGSCLEVLEAGKPLVVVVNEKLMDNHQIELAQQLYNDGHLLYCTCRWWWLENNTTVCMIIFLGYPPFPDNSEIFASFRASNSVLTKSRPSYGHWIQRPTPHIIILPVLSVKVISKQWPFQVMPLSYFMCNHQC